MEKLIKKTFNVPADLAQEIDDFMKANPHISFTLMVQESIKSWLRGSCQIEVRKPSKAEVDERMNQFIAENSELMDRLAQ